MRTLGLIAAVVLIVLLVAGSVLFTQRARLRTWQAARHARQVFDAAEQARARAESSPGDVNTLGGYAAGLFIEGNLGRALYLTELYDIELADASALREEIETAIKRGSEGQFHSVSESAVAQTYKREPLYQALLFLDGYRHALLGDWSSAKNYFEKIQQRTIAAPLRPYTQYYLARSYRLAGTAEQRQQAEQIWLKLIAREAKSSSAELAAKARYNLVAYYLSEAYAGTDAQKLASAQLKESDDWPYQRALNEFARYYARKGDVAAAWDYAQRAILAQGNTESKETALDTCLEILSREDFSSAAAESAAPKFEEIVGEAMVDAAQTPVQRHRVVAVLKALHSTFKTAEVPAVRGLAKAAAAEGDASQVAELRSATPAFGAMAKEAVLFHIAEAEAGAEQWNAALADYKACAQLGGSMAGEAWYECYHILKKVQDPLNLSAAEEYLENAIKARAKGEAHHKALEELIPLVVNRDTLSPVVEGALNDAMKVAEDSLSTDDLRLLKMVQAWGNKVSSKRPAWKAHPHQRHLWSYYEILDVYPPQLESSDELPFSGPGHAAECFAGLGLNDLAAEATYDKGSPTNELLAYWQLRNREPTASQEVLAWYATEELEEGQFQSAPATKYALALAYPRPFDDIVLPAARQFAIPPALVYAIIKKESGFKESALSGQGAEGLMQVMPDTASLVNERYQLGIDLSHRTLPENNIRLGCANLRSLFDMFGNDNIRAVISAHNKGPGNYQKWKAQYPAADEVLFTELIPNEENEGFSKLVWKYYMIYKWLEESP